MKIISDPSSENLVGLCSVGVVSAIADAWGERKVAHIVLTGGRTGTAIAKAVDQSLFKLLRENSTFEGCMLHVWFSDERCVGFDDPDRTDRILIAEFGLTKSHIVFHSVEDLPDFDESAKRYATELSLELGTREFDAVVLSMGEDGHIASLFPGLFDPKVAALAIAVHNSPKLPPKRVSISLSRLAQGRHIFIFVLGQEKAEAFKALSDENQIQKPPVLLLRESSPDSQLAILTDLPSDTRE